MNANQLLQVIDLMRRMEASSGIQGILQDPIANNLQQLAASPGTEQWQTALSESLTQLEAAQERALSGIGPEDREAIGELGGSRFFLDNKSEYIKQLIQNNAATLQVASNELQAKNQERASFINGLEAISTNMHAMGINIPPLGEGEAELGIKIPRTAFSNTLEGLQAELRLLNRIIRALSEVASGSPDVAEVRQISTSDPLFVLGLPVVTILMVAGTVTWALDTWKKVEEIRKVRADVRKLELENAATIADQLEKEIEDKVKLLVDAKVKMILGKRFEEEGRAQEQRVDLTQVLGLVLDQVQKGVTIQVRLGPPPPADGPDVAPAVKTRSRQFAELAQVRQKLSFPGFSEEPLTFLSRPANDDKGSGGTE